VSPAAWRLRDFVVPEMQELRGDASPRSPDHTTQMTGETGRSFYLTRRSWTGFADANCFKNSHGNGRVR